jgi:hypothetical protein
VKPDGVSPRKRRASWKASAGAFSLNTTEFGAGLEGVGSDLEKRIVQAVAAACGKALQGLQNEITKLKSTVEEQKELILRLGASIEATKAVPLPIPLTYAAAAATQAGTTAVKARANGPLSGLQLTASPPKTSPTDQYVTVDCREVEEGARDLLPAKIRKGIEERVRVERKEPGWRCWAVVSDRKNELRWRVLCRSETEMEIVKKAAEATKIEGARVLRDQLFLVKIDNVKARAVLSLKRSIREEALAALEDENGVKLAKLAWLSKKDMVKEYGLMVVYFRKRQQALEALQNGFFVVGSESATTNDFLRTVGPVSCFKC